MEDIKKKIIEKLKKLEQQEKEKQEEVHQAKLEGGDTLDNQDYQFSLADLIRIKQQKSDLQSRLEQIEEEKEKKYTKVKGIRKSIDVPIVGRKFSLEVTDEHTNQSKTIIVTIVPLYEEIEANPDQNSYSITTESPLSKMIERIIQRFIPEIERKIEKILSTETNPESIAMQIENMNEWIVISNHSKFTKKIRELASDKEKLLRELNLFLKQAEIDSSKIFQALIGKEFNLKVQDRSIKYKIISVN
ncbi:MAG: hypothetical protein ABDH21_01490 [bacterium]